MIRSMLFATDLGVYSPYIMQHALALARTFGAELHVIHVVEPVGQFAESLLQSYLDERTLNQLHQQGVNTVLSNIEERMLENFRDELPEKEDLALIRAVRVRQGVPSQVILEQAERLGVELVIVGSHCQGAGTGIPLGRTAERVLQLSSVPVYLVPLAQQLGRRRA